MNQKTRKLMMMHEALHLRDNKDLLYVSRKKGGRVLVSIHDSVDASIQRLKDYIQKGWRRLITAIRNNTDNTSINRTKITRKQICEGKQLYGHFMRQTNEISHWKKLSWLKKGNLKRETKSLLRAAQNNAIRTNYIKSRIDKTQQT